MLSAPPIPSAVLGYASYTVASIPAFCRAIAVTGPAMPPPITNAVLVWLMIAAGRCGTRTIAGASRFLDP